MDSIIYQYVTIPGSEMTTVCMYVLYVCTYIRYIIRTQLNEGKAELCAICRAGCSQAPGKFLGERTKAKQVDC